LYNGSDDCVMSKDIFYDVIVKKWGNIGSLHYVYPVTQEVTITYMYWSYGMHISYISQCPDPLSLTSDPTTAHMVVVSGQMATAFRVLITDCDLYLSFTINSGACSYCTDIDHCQ